MTLQILAVGMLDHEVFGRDTFWVQTGEDECMLYEAHKDGRVVPVVDEVAPLRYVTASIEKFNNTYRVEQPIPLDKLEDLPKYIGKFAPTSPTACALVEQPD